MTKIVPTVTAYNPHQYRDQIERLELFAKRLHIDIADGEFAPTKTINPIQAWWPEHIEADIHMMVKDSSQHLETAIGLNPSLIILHAESENVKKSLENLQNFKVKSGLAILPDTQIDQIKDLIEFVDYVLIFGGKLGYQGGTADFEQLSKVSEVKKIKDVEIAWDGGINSQNAKKIVESGVEVLNVGGFIGKSENPQKAYQELVDLF